MFIPLAIVMVQAPAPVPPPAKPDPVPPSRIELTTPFPVHLGSVGPREACTAVFGIRSMHDRPFRFRLLDLSLGASLDEASFSAPLKPGEVRMVAVNIDPSGLEGFVKGAVRLGTDDPAQPNYILRWDMVVRPEVTVDAERRSLGDVAPHETPEARFRFVREGGEPLKVVLASQIPPHLEAAVVQQGTRTDLLVTLHPGRLPPGTTAGLDLLKVSTNSPRQPQFTLYLDWRLATAVVPNPSRLVFNDLKTTLLGLELTARDGQPFRITRAEILGQGFELLGSPGQMSRRQTLRVRRTGRHAEALLVLECSNQDSPLKVPLRFLDPSMGPSKQPGSVPPSLAEPAHRD